MSIYTELIKSDSPPEFIKVMNAKSEMMALWDSAANNPEFWVKALAYYNASLDCPNNAGGGIFDYVERSLVSLGLIDGVINNEFELGYTE